MEATMRDRGMIYNAVDHLVLLYCSESWVVTGEIIKVLEVLKHWGGRLITGMTKTLGAGGEC